MNRLWSILAVVAGAFPFAALGYKLFETSSIAGVVYALIVVTLVGSVLVASRADITLPTDAAAAGAAVGARQPAPPIRWSWDGIDRQPGAEQADAEAGQGEHTH